MDGIRNEGRRVIAHNVLEPRRKLSAQAVHSSPYQGGGLDRIGAWGQIDAQSNRGPTVDAALHVLILGAEFHPGDVADAQQRTIGIGAQNNAAELLGSREPALRLQVYLKLLIVSDRAGADPADRRLGVLRLYRGDHVCRGKGEAVEPLG